MLCITTHAYKIKNMKTKLNKKSLWQRTVDCKQKWSHSLENALFFLSDIKIISCEGERVVRKYEEEEKNPHSTLNRKVLFHFSGYVEDTQLDNSP